MGFARPSLRDLIARIKGDISSRTQGSAYIKRSFERVLADGLAGLANGLHMHFEWLLRQQVPTTSDLPRLVDWGDWLKVPQKGASFAAGMAMFTNSTPTIGPDLGTVMQTSDGILFQTTAVVAVDSGGVLRVPIIAVSPGSSGNLDDGTPLTLLQPFTGLNSNGQVGVGDGIGTTGGSDVEGTEDYRPRILDNLRLPPAGGGVGDYVAWALEVPGVTRAWEFGNLTGSGTVSLAFVMDGRSNIIPTALDIANVQGHIDSVRPLDMRACYVLAPIPLSCDVTLSVTPDTAAVRAAVTQEIKLLFLRSATVSKALPISKLEEAISTSIGEEDHDVIAAGPLDPGPFGLLILGNINFV